MTSATRIPAAGIVSILLNATSVALIGASDDGTKASGRTLRYLRKYGFAGEVYPVNPRRDIVQGEATYARVADIPVVADLAVIVLPQGLVENAIEECGRSGIRFAVVFASGYGETGPAGAVLEASLTSVAARFGVRILGPNSVGAVSAPNAMTAAFMTGLDQERFELRDDGIAFVSQSGAMGGFILNMAQTDGVGVGRFFSTGNEADLSLGELIEGLVEEGSTRAVLAYVEGIKEGAVFERALERARARRVPVCVMKVGRSQRGAAAAASHTGALAGSDEVFDGVLARYGMPRAGDVEQLLDLGRLFLTDKLAVGRKVSIVTLSGGAGVLMSDYAEDLGLDVFEWTSDQQAKMSAILPSFASVSNPIDTTGAIASNQGMLTDALRVCVENPQTDIAIILLGNLEKEERQICERIIEVAAATSKPVLVAWVGGSGNPRRILTDAGVPTFSEPVRAMRAAAALATWSSGLAATDRVRSFGTAAGGSTLLEVEAANGRSMLDEVESKQLLKAAGVPVTRELAADSAAEAVTAANSLGYPVVVKLLSAEVEHKSDVGGVKLGLSSDEDVRSATEAILAVATTLGLEERRVVVQESVRGGAELIMGARNDPSFGPVVMIGAGGVFTEILADVQVRPAPIDVDEAGDMIDALAAVKLLRGVRGMPVADERMLAQVISNFSVMIAEAGDLLESVDVNPLIVRQSGDVVALDAVVRLRSGGAENG